MSNIAMTTNKERKPDTSVPKNDFGETAKALEQLSKQTDWQHVAKVGVVIWGTFLFAVFSLLVTVKAAFAIF